MATDPNKLNADELKKLIELLQKIDNLTKQVAESQAQQAQAAGNARGQLERLEETYKELTSDVSYAAQGFRKIVQEITNQNVGLKESTKAYKGLTSIADKLQSYQKGYSELSSKDLKKLKDQAKVEKQRLENAQSLLKEKESDYKKSKSINEASVKAKQAEIALLTTKAGKTKQDYYDLQKLRNEVKNLNKDYTAINLELDKTTDALTQNQAILEGEDELYKGTLLALDEAARKTKNLEKSLGLSGLAVEGIGKAFNKLGLGGLSSAMGLDEAKEKMKEVADEVTEGGDKAAGLIGKFKILGAGLSVIGKNIFSYLTDPLTIATGLVTGLIAGVKSLISLFEESAKYTGDIAKSFGVSANEAAKIGGNLRSAAGSDFFMTTEEARKAFDVMAEATGTINANFSDPKAVSAMNDLVTYAGYSTEEAKELYKIGQLNNQSVDDTVAGLQGQLQILQKNNKLRINEKQAVEMVAKASATVRMNLGSNPKALAQAAFYATKLGMTLDEISSAAEQTLDFESSIQNQLEYQLLTGKEINVDAYQQAAASGDAAAASKELNKLIEEQGPAIQGNVFAQESLAKTLGISREQLMKSIELQKLQKKLGGDVAQIEEAINRKMKDGLSY